MKREREWWERIVLDYVAGCAHEYAEHRRSGVASEPMTVEEAHRWEIGTLATVLEELRREHERQAWRVVCDGEVGRDDD